MIDLAQGFPMSLTRLKRLWIGCGVMLASLVLSTAGARAEAPALAFGVLN